MNDINNLFFELIRVAIGNAVSLSCTPSAAEWQTLYELAKKQSLVGICFAGVQRLQKQEQRPPEMLCLKWMGMAAKIQQRNEIVDSHCIELNEMLSASGYDFCIVKGQTNNVNYKLKDLSGAQQDLSALRQSGDIDVWVDADWKSLAAYVKRKADTDEITDTHIQLHVFDDTEVELHYCLMKMANPFRQRFLKKWLNGQKREQMMNEIPFKSGSLHSPTIEFNLVYQLLHIYKHLFGEGIGLRQLMDYYFLLQRAFVTNDDHVKVECLRENARHVVHNLGLDRFASALMWVLGKVFGLGMINMPWTPNEKEGKFLLDEIMQAGNFGQQDVRFVRSREDNHLKRYLQLVASKLRFWSHYPAETFLFSIDYFVDFFKLRYLKYELNKIS